MFLLLVITVVKKQSYHLTLFLYLSLLLLKVPISHFAVFSISYCPHVRALIDIHTILYDSCIQCMKYVIQKLRTALYKSSSASTLCSHTQLADFTLAVLNTFLLSKQHPSSIAIPPGHFETLETVFLSTNVMCVHIKHLHSH